MPKMATPKFLTVEIAKTAVDAMLRATMCNPEILKLLKRRDCHIVILVPSTEDARDADFPDWPNYELKPHCLYEHSVGDKKEWKFNFDDIARCKALQLWQGRNDDRSDVIPHLLFAGDAPFWGGVKRQGIVVTCSGVQPWFDKMIAGMIADMLIGLTYNAWMTSDDKKNDATFLG